MDEPTVDECPLDEMSVEQLEKKIEEIAALEKLHQETAEKLETIIPQKSADQTHVSRTTRLLELIQWLEDKGFSDKVKETVIADAHRLFVPIPGCD